MRRLKLILSLVIVFSAAGQAQILRSFQAARSSESSLPSSNVIDDIVIRSDTIWTGTGHGLSYTVTGGASWRHLDKSFGFKELAISALAIRGNVIWASEGSSIKRDGSDVPVGEGLYYSLNSGATWTYIPQPVEPKDSKVDTLIYGANKILALAVTVTPGNHTYDIALTSTTVWTANFYGMLRKSTDDGKTWTRVILPPDFLNSIKPSDVLNFDLSPSTGNLGLRESLNHRVFSVFAGNDSVIWVGTAGGINKSTDGGVSWRKFSHQNQLRPISGNFVVAINEQRWKGEQIIWAATVNALDPDEKRGLSFSEDGGESWNTTLLGEFVHNIAFKDSIVYAATDNGLYRSADFGATWLRSGSIIDQTTLQRIASPVIHTVATKGDTVWMGGVDGLAYTIDSASRPFGTTWKIFRTYQPVANTPSTYSYPSPFSPDDEVVRIHYGTLGKNTQVTIRIFNYAMQPVRTLIQNATRTGSFEHDEIWNGRDDFGSRVSNGVYFYRVEGEGLEPAWGKIYVVE